MKFEEYCTSNIYEESHFAGVFRTAYYLETEQHCEQSRVKKKSFYASLPFMEASVYEIKASRCYRYALKRDTWINVRVYSYSQLNLAAKLIKESLGKLVRQLVNLCNSSCTILFFAKEFMTLSADTFYLFSTL